jgi:hypothetical protein
VSALLLTALLVNVSADAPSAAPDGVRIHVPFLAQSEKLCGGAALAMVFRYWGDAHADVEQFEPLVDRRAGGIADSVLVHAAIERGWQATRLTPTLQELRDELNLSRPIVLLVQTRPGRFHYVVAVGTSMDDILVHDPTWGPYRRMRSSELTRAWQATGFWALRVLPGTRQLPRVSPAAPEAPSSREKHTACDGLVDEAIAEIRRKGLAFADDILAVVRRRCPDDARPISELAGVRFAQNRWAEAEHLAERALTRDGGDRYAWDVLGSARFLQNHTIGALHAWNHIGKPKVDLVNIEGLERTPYALITQSLPVSPNSLLTVDRYLMAGRRLELIPSLSTSKIDYTPQPDGFATVQIIAVERKARPGGLLDWAALGGSAIINREVSTSLPGGLGQGELWTGKWRWWPQRPRVELGFSAPRFGRLPGTWRVEALWEKESYASTALRAVVQEPHTHVGAVVTDWIRPDLRYEFSAGMDEFAGNRRTSSFWGALNRRFWKDRVSAGIAFGSWLPIGNAERFYSFDSTVRGKSSQAAELEIGWDIGLAAVSANAPLVVWPGAGDGHARVPLLRGHRLIEDGIIRGPAFGRQLFYAHVESVRWLSRPTLAKVAVAAFIDGARATERLPGWPGKALQIDVGVGLRAKMPGREGLLRVDYGQGLADRGHAITVGWQR